MSSINLPITVSLAGRGSVTSNDCCKICGSNQWFLRDSRWNTTERPVNAPCTWVKSDGTTAYAHTGSVLLAAIFKYTIEGQSINLDFREIPSDYGGKYALANKLINKLHNSCLGKELNTPENLKNLKDSTNKKSNYEVLQMFEGVDIVQALSWMTRKDPINSSSSDESSEDEVLSIAPSDREQDSDSDDDAFVDW